MIEVGHIQMSDDTAELFAALAKAQSLYESVSKDSKAEIHSKKGASSSYTYNYATLDAIMDEVRPHLTKNEICTVQSPHTEGNDVTVTTLLGHASGQWICGSVTLQATETHAQAAGAILTYCRRYSLQALVGVTPETDDDASSAVGLGASASTNPQTKTACPKCKKTGTIIKGKEEYGGGWICWKSKEGCGAKFDTDPALDTPPAETVNIPAPDSHSEWKYKLENHNKIVDKDPLGEWGTKLQEFIRGKLEHPTKESANAWMFQATGGTEKDAVAACQDEDHAKLLYETFIEKETLI